MGNPNMRLDFDKNDFWSHFVKIEKNGRKCMKNDRTATANPEPEVEHGAMSTLLFTNLSIRNCPKIIRTAMGVSYCMFMFMFMSASADPAGPSP